MASSGEPPSPEKEKMEAEPTDVSENLNSTFTKLEESVRSAPAPIAQRLDVPDIFDPFTNLPNPSLVRDHFAGEGRLTEEAALKILRGAADVFRKEKTVLAVTAPVTVVGDIHGQYFDLLKLTAPSVGGDPATTQYLFLGDYVDRGSFSIECLLYILTLKQVYPSTIHLIRGNHECRHLTSYFSFKKETETKYSDDVYEAALAAFNTMPLAAVLNDRFFCVHGGLSPEVNTVEDVLRINRFREPPPHGAMCDLLWADPTPDFGASSPSSEHFKHNPVRGCSYQFTYNAVSDFLTRNKFLAVIRAHEAQQEGYKMHRVTDEALGGFPSLITVFSAPNYLDVYGNKGAVLKYDGTTLNIRQFNHSEHPYWLPNFSNVFSWSLPFVGDKVTEMLVKLLNICSDDELNQDGDDKFEGGMTMDRKRAIRGKIQAVGRMHRHFATLRDESEAVLVLKGLSPSGQLPPGTLAEGSQGLQSAIDLLAEKGTEHKRLREVASFDEAKCLDSPNEHIPPPLSKLRSGNVPAPRDVGPLTRQPLRPLTLFKGVCVSPLSFSLSGLAQRAHPPPLSKLRTGNVPAPRDVGPLTRQPLRPLTLFKGVCVSPLSFSLSGLAQRAHPPAALQASDWQRPCSP